MPLCHINDFLREKMSFNKKIIFGYICSMKEIFLAFCAALLLGACTENKPAVKLTKTYIADSLHFSIKHPENWEVLKDPDQGKSIAIVEKQGDKKDSYQENIVCWLEEMPMAVSDSVYATAAVTQLKIANPTLDIRKKGEAVLGSNHFSSFTFDFSGKNKTPYEVMGFCIVKGKRGYNFSCTALKSSMPEYLPLFREILSTFKPL